MWLTSLPLPLILHITIPVPKCPFSMLKASLPKPLIPPSIHHLVHAISIALIVIIDLACVGTPTLHCNSHCILA